MISPRVLKDLQDIIEANLDITLLPYKKGNSIRIGSMVVRESKHGHLVYSIKQNKQIARTFSKTAAVAIAKSGKVNEILYLDHQVQKHFNDCLFYKNTITKTKNEVTRSVAENRYEISSERTRDLKDKMDSYIFY